MASGRTILNDFYAGLLPDNVTSADSFCNDVMASLEEPFTKRSFVNAAMLSSSTYQLAEAVVKAALMPYEARQHQTGSYGKPRSDSIRARAMTATNAKKERKTSATSNRSVRTRRTHTF
ncbi:hypothetical protein CAPTEDRAFT_225916 [Capitella teleta]|uniref:Uncharacterized protein n=1 Tax=Capitella teleta TaxID=283909 RepID=R7UUL9_CAPTE|nr:hypothetical protein CAPTEDRAFT_225916 [Capitella teleta]|eukprot:ELU09868.1 hypothetical protein CAPTEDRAFT_225916 [Capitella teleta]